MRTSYQDVIDKAGDPLWYDEYGVPRYSIFSPEQCGVYIKATALLIIECQSCKERFTVATVWDNTFHFMEQIQLALEKGGSTWPLAKMEEEPSILFPPSYGDPPRHSCDGAGDTMSSDTISVAEYWAQPNGWNLDRQEEIEERWNKELQG